MKRIIPLLFIITILFSCKNNDSEKTAEIEIKQRELDLKEREIVLREKEIELKTNDSLEYVQAQEQAQEQKIRRKKSADSAKVAEKQKSIDDAIASANMYAMRQREMMDVDIEQIKSDLIGKSVSFKKGLLRARQTWNFDELCEFQKISLQNTNRDGNYITKVLNINLIDCDNQNKSFLKLWVSYRKEYDVWVIEKWEALDYYNY